MNRFTKLITLIVMILSCTVTMQLKAQTISSKIMDAVLQTDSGKVTVYLTDTLGLSGIDIAIGTTSGNYNSYSQQFTISGNSFGSNGVVADNTLKTTVSGLNNQQDYYMRIRVLLSNSSFNEIVIHSQN